MAKYMISRSYYDGRDAYDKEIGLIKGKDHAAFIAHLEKCGYEGHQTKEDVWEYGATIDVGELDHHGNHMETYYIVRYRKEEHRKLSPDDWKKEIHSFGEHGYTKTADGIYVREDSDEDEDFWENEPYESDSDDETEQTEDELSFEDMLNEYRRGRR